MSENAKVLIIIIIFGIAAYAIYATWTRPVGSGTPAVYTPQYGAAKFIGSLTSFMGWVVFVIGVLAGVAGVYFTFSLSLDPREGPGQPLLMMAAAGGTAFSFQLALFGLLLAGLGQHFRATADAANHSGEMLALMKAGSTAPPLEQSLPTP